MSASIGNQQQLDGTQDQVDCYRGTDERLRKGAGGSLSGEPLVAMEPQCDADNCTRQKSRYENPRDVKDLHIT